MKKLLELVRKGYLYALLCLVTGLMLVIWPEQTVWGVYFAAAAAVILLGAVRIVRYFRQGAVEGLQRLTFASGAILAVVGLMLIVYRIRLDVWLPQLVGFALLAVTCIRLQGSLDLLRRGFSRWWWALIVAGVILTCGILCLVTVFSLKAKLIIAGSCLVIEAVTHFLCSLWFGKTDRPGKDGREIKPASYTYTWTAEDEAEQPAEAEPSEPKMANEPAAMPAPEKAAEKEAVPAEKK